ncbi:hypothetical protein ABPG72_007233 [Tetrahymena utriculariae]
MDQLTYKFFNIQTEYEEQKQNKTIQMGEIDQENLDIEFAILEIINNQLGLSSSRASQMNHFRISQYQMQGILSQYKITDESSNGISSYIKTDGSSAFLFNIFCQPETIEEILFSIKSKISYVYYDVENFNILLIIDSQFGIINQQKTEYFNEQFLSSQIPLETFLQTNFDNQQKILKKFGITKKKQLRLIVGTQGTPFEGLVYTLRIRIPDQYPYEPPQITFNQYITHPNVNVYEELCLDILMDQWTSISTLYDYVISIRMPYQENSDLYKMLLRQEYILQQKQNVAIDYQEIEEQVKQQQSDIERQCQESDNSYIPGLEDEQIE